MIANGTPLWLQDSPESRALRECVADFLGASPSSSCGTDAGSRSGYRAALAAAGFGAAREVVLTGAEPLTSERVAGNVYSALDEERLPADREAFEAGLRAALPPGPFVEQVRIAILVASRPA